MSRRAALSVEIISVIEEHTKRAHWPHVVARRLGVHKRLWDSWMKTGEQAHLADTDGEPGDANYLYRQLFERIEEAEAFAEIDLLEQARAQAELGKTSWNGFLTTMERRFSDRWRRREATAGELAETFEAQAKKFMLQQKGSDDPLTSPDRLRAVE